MRILGNDELELAFGGRDGEGIGHPGGGGSGSGGSRGHSPSGPSGSRPGSLSDRKAYEAGQHWSTIHDDRWGAPTDKGDRVHRGDTSPAHPQPLSDRQFNDRWNGNGHGGNAGGGNGHGGGHG